MKKILIALIALGVGLTLAQASEMKCGAGKCGGQQEKKVDKKKKETSSKCGAEHMEKSEGKCGKGH